MPKGDPAGYLPSVLAARKGGKGKNFGSKKFGKKAKGKSAPIQKSLRAGGRFGGAR